MKVEECMNKEAITINSGANAIEALELMVEHRVSSLPVVDENNCLAGFISKKDLANSVEENLENCMVEQFMTKEVLLVQSEDLLKTALDHMLDNNVNRLPVVKDNKLVGIVTRDDVINYFYGHE